jgi:hypothetical protein
LRSACERPEAPPEKRAIRAETYYGVKYEATADGTKITVLISLDPGGVLPTAIVNFAVEGQMKAVLQSYKTYFVDRKAPDGSDNGGVWPDDENLYNYRPKLARGNAGKLDGGGGGGRGGSGGEPRAESTR